MASIPSISSSEEDPFINLSDNDPEFSPDLEQIAKKRKTSKITDFCKISSISSKKALVSVTATSATTSSTPTETENYNLLASTSKILDGTFFELKDSTSDTTEAVCQLCKPTIKIIKGYKNTTTNFLKHIKRVHPGEQQKYETYKKKIFKAKGQQNQNEATKKQQRIESYTKNKIDNRSIITKTSKTTFNMKILNFIIDTMSPISIIENNSFRALFEGTPYQDLVISRKTAVKKLSDLYDKQVHQLSLKLKSVNFVCTTADIWSGKKRSFMGVTIHWIESDLSRKSAALSCKRIMGIHDFEKIAEHLENINLKFGLDQSKIVATVTDNASNFIKAFKEFHTEPNEDESMSKDEAEEDSDNTDVDIEIIDLGVPELRHVLPNHVRCASHSLNLIATTDCQNAIKSNTGLRTRHMFAIDKCRQLWNKAGRPKTAETIQEILGHSLSYPGQTRWNALYDSIGQILKEKCKLPLLFEKLEIPYFKETEIHYLEEYHKIMGPLASTLDFLQGQETTYFGYLLPSLVSMKNKLLKLQSDDLKYGGEILQKTVLEGLERRFHSYLHLEDERALIAAVLCPHLKMRWLGCLDLEMQLSVDQIKKIILKAALKIKETKGDNSPPEEYKSEDNFFDFNENDIFYKNTLTETGTAKRNLNTKIELELMKYLDDKRKNLQMLNDYSTLKKLFIKYNTILPSSAPVERLFSYASMIDSPRRNSLSDSNFERFVVMKANRSQ